MSDGATESSPLDAPSPARVTATHLYASNGSTDTETKVLVASQAKSVTLSVRMLPGNIHWSLPPADVLRTWADGGLEGTGRKRTGRRHITAYENSWSITWMTEPTTA